jgi:hypothetical protein
VWWLSIDQPPNDGPTSAIESGWLMICQPGQLLGRAVTQSATMRQRAGR